MCTCRCRLTHIHVDVLVPPPWLLEVGHAVASHAQAVSGLGAGSDAELLIPINGGYPAGDGRPESIAGKSVWASSVSP